MADSFDPRRQAGLFDSLRLLTGSALELLHVRIELFSVEWQEEQERGKTFLILGVAGVVLLLLGLLLLTLFVIVLFWDSYRLSAIGALTVLYLGSGGVCLWLISHRLKHRPPPFASSLGEFVEDLKQLKLHRPEAGPAVAGSPETPAPVSHPMVSHPMDDVRHE